MESEGEHESIEAEDLALELLGVVDDAPGAVRDPLGGGEVHRLPTVKAVAEAGMVCLREGHDEVPLLLRALVHRHVVLLENRG